MTEDIIKSITIAETEAEQIKTDALEKAAAIMAAAEEKVIKKERSATESFKAYRETQMKQAIEQADMQYEKTIAENLQKAKAYCEKTLQDSETHIGEIVRRIISGDC